MGQVLKKFGGGEVEAPQISLPDFAEHCVNGGTPQRALPECEGTFDKEPPIDCYQVADSIGTWRTHINGHLQYHSDRSAMSPADLYIWIVMTDGSIRYFDHTAWNAKHAGSVASASDYPGHTSMLGVAELAASKVKRTSPVNYGGELYSGPDGKAVRIRNFSGHFHPDPQYIKAIGTALGVPNIQEVSSAYYGYYNLAPNPDNARGSSINMLDFDDKDYSNPNGYYVGAGHIGNGNNNNEDEMVIDTALLLMSALLLLLILCIIGCICGVIGYFTGKTLQKKQLSVLSADYSQV